MSDIKILVGDVRDKLSELATDSVQCIVSSHPYWALRDYGTGTWKGGKKTCKHTAQIGLKCKCGSTLIDSQIGLEPNLSAWIDTMVGVCKGLKRVLRPDGTMWLNGGDNYAAFDTSFGIKKKDLVLQTHHLAMALRSDGWFLRMADIWYKPGILPESVTDRPTVTHEYMMGFTKNPDYYYDAEAVRTKTANLRSVWMIQAQSWENEGEKHHATYPEKLVEPCILASTSEVGACRKCGAPWKRVGHLEEEYAKAVKATRGGAPGDLRTGTAMKDRIKAGTSLPRIFITTGWEPSCAHKSVGDPVPCLVLDPFSGSGTTMVVAKYLKRDGVGIELDPKQAKAGLKRIAERPKRLLKIVEEKRDITSMAEALADDPGPAGALARAVLA